MCLNWSHELCPVRWLLEITRSLLRSPEKSKCQTSALKTEVETHRTHNNLLRWSDEWMQRWARPLWCVFSSYQSVFFQDYCSACYRNRQRNASRWPSFRQAAPATPTYCYEIAGELFVIAVFLGGCFSPAVFLEPFCWTCSHGYSWRHPGPLGSLVLALHSNSHPAGSSATY